MNLLLGLDIGTSSAKAILFDPDTSQIRAIAAREYVIHKPAPERAEQNPDDWWRACVEATREALALAGRSDVAAIGLSGQMHGGVLLGRDQKPLGAAIIWADQRSAETSKALAETVGREQYLARTGTLPAAGFMGPTLLWLSENEPQLLENAWQIILPKDYVRLQLTGEVATDFTDAAGTGLFDISKKEWAQNIIAHIGVAETLFPPVGAPDALAGELLNTAAEALGLRPGIPVVAGCADQPAQALANGVIAPGNASVTTGSGGQVFAPLRLEDTSRQTDARLHVFNHAVPDTWYVLGAILAAGLALRWLRNVTGLADTANAYTLLSKEAASVPPGAEGLIFLPYLSGERTPHMDALARGSFVGLSYKHERGHLARAVMEGVAFALRQTLEIVRQISGEAHTVIAAGGGAESDVWRQIQADVFGRPLQQTLLTEQAGVGAALLAGVGSGVYSDVAEASALVVRHGPITEPNVKRSARYNELYAHFLELYPRLRDDFHRLSTQ